MVVSEELLNKLRHHFGLNLYEVKVWAALLSRGKSTAGELSDISNVPRSRTYDILESLEKKGFVVMKIGKPIKYLAVSPSEVLERAKKYVQMKAKDDVKKIDVLRNSDLLRELEILHKNGIEFIEPADLTGALRGRTNYYMHMDTLMKKAKKEIYLVTTPEGLIRKYDWLKPTLQHLKRRNVKVKIAVPVNKKSAVIVQELRKYADIRDLKKINSRFCVVDQSDVLFALSGEDEVHPNYEVGIWVNTPYFAKTLTSLFENVWGSLEPADKILKKFK